MAETIKEFLVGLGYKVDGGSEAKFSRSVETATKAVIALGVAAVAASTAVTAAVTKIAAGFDDLYYASQRTKASAENIKAVGFAVSQLGGSYQGAVSSIEAFALKMRSNPGYETMARNLGVVTRENGKLKDTTVIMTDLAKVLAKKPAYVALQYLEALGIDEATYNALKSGDLVRYTEEYRKKQEAVGVTQTRATEVGRDLTNAWRSLSATAAALGDKMLVSLGPGLKDFVDRVDAFLVRNADRIVGFFEKAAEWVGKLLAAFVQLVEKGEGPIREFFDKMTAGVGEMTKAFDKFATFLAGAFLLSVAATFAAVGANFASMLMKLGPLGAAILGGYLVKEGLDSDEDFRRRKDAIDRPGGRNPFQAIDDADKKRARPEDTRTLWEKRPVWMGGKPDPAAPTDTRSTYEKWAPGFLGGKPAPTAPAGNSTATIQPGSFADKAPGIMKRLQEDFGFTKEQAAGIMGNLGHESAGLKVLQEQNPTGGGRGGYGWAQWTGPRRRAFEAWAADKGLDPASDEANYGFLKHELRTTHKSSVDAVKATKTADEAMVAFENDFERAGIKAWGSRQKWTERALAAANAAPSSSSGSSEAGGTSTESDAAAYKRATGRDLAKDLAENPYVKTWAEQMIGRKLQGPAANDDVRGRENPPLPFAKLNPTALSQVQANASLVGSGSQPSLAAPLAPATGSTTSVDMQQKTEITILGGDPQATAREVAGAQDKVNGGLIRNMQGAVR